MLTPGAENEGMTTGTKRTSSKRPEPARTSRYPIATDALYRLTRNGAVLVAGRGRTVEMSAVAVVLDLDHPVQNASRIELSLEWLGLYHGCESAQLRVYGQVVSTEGRRAEVRILQHRFETYGSAQGRYIASRQRAVA
jgi:hypothetical protein